MDWPFEGWQMGCDGWEGYLLHSIGVWKSWIYRVDGTWLRNTMDHGN
jgi:hypothetical protein